jgi:1-acyl-sn-glycerol-3-phosphate acyltransferase
MKWPDPGHKGVVVRFGEPFVVPRELNGKRLSADEATDLMMIELARMLPPDYRGVYADRVTDAPTLPRPQREPS